MASIRTEFRVVISSALWENAYSELESENQHFAWGKVHRSYDRNRRTCDLSVREMRFCERPPQGSRFSSVEDWILMAVQSNLDTESIQTLIEQSDLKFGQTLVLLVLGKQQNREAWIGAVVTREEAIPIEEFRLIGPRMPIFSRSNDKLITSPAYDPRWSRQIGAMGTTFDRFHNGRVFLVGAGRLGSLLAESWVRSGLSDLTVADADTLEIHNLDATFGSSEKKIGQPKVVCLLEHLESIRSDARLRGLCHPIDDPLVLETAREAELIVSCVDNTQARLLASKIATRLMKVHLDIGTLVQRTESRFDANETTVFPDSQDSETGDSNRMISADIRLLLPGTCVSCVGGVREEISDERTNSSDDLTLEFDEQKPASGLDWQRGGRAGSLLSINLMAVGTATQLWLDLLGGQVTQSFWHRIRWAQGSGIESAAGPVRRLSDCPNCGPESPESSGR